MHNELSCIKKDRDDWEADCLQYKYTDQGHQRQSAKSAYFFLGGGGGGSHKAKIGGVLYLF